jgi:hypothetical protein
MLISNISGLRIWNAQKLCKSICQSGSGHCDWTPIEVTTSAFTCLGSAQAGRPWIVQEKRATPKSWGYLRTPNLGCDDKNGSLSVHICANLFTRPPRWIWDVRIVLVTCRGMDSWNLFQPAAAHGYKTLAHIGVCWRREAEDFKDLSRAASHALGFPWHIFLLGC